MKPGNLFLAVAAITAFSACRPQPLDIHVPQKDNAIVISSACIDDHTILLSASYSFNSFLAVLDTARNESGALIPRGLLIDSAVVTITQPSGARDTLQQLSDGVWSSTKLRLQPGTDYRLSVLDLRKNLSASAVTTYMPAPAIDTFFLETTKSQEASITRLKLRMRNAQPGSHFLVAYNTMSHARENSIPLPRNTRALNLFTPKQVELFTVAGSEVDQSVTLQVNATDTVLLHIGQVDKNYFEYLSAYKRSGALINQMTGEPINLPGNILGGFGFFSLYQPLRRIYDLNKH